MTTGALFLIMMAFLAGLALGGMLKDAQWREKARNGTRMLSKGRLFTIDEEFPKND